MAQDRYRDFRLIQFDRQDKFLTAIIDNPPINLMTLDLFGELSRLSTELADDPSVLVFRLKSANPDFFIAHFDVAAILNFPTDGEPSVEAARANPFHAMCERFASMEKVTIAQIEGRVGGGGSEMSMAFDMRFGVTGRTVINQMEVPLGILPGGSGTQRLPRLIGRARALEVILGGIDLPADTAERWGYLNRCLPANEIDGFVCDLAARICSFPEQAVRLAKQSVCNAAGPMDEGLVREALMFQTLARSAAGRRNMARFLEIGGQTMAGEKQVAELSRLLGET